MALLFTLSDVAPTKQCTYVDNAGAITARTAVHKESENPLEETHNFIHYYSTTAGGVSEII